MKKSPGAARPVALLSLSAAGSNAPAGSANTGHPKSLRIGKVGNETLLY